ncbi:MAG TPA: hypothetical protein VGB45_15310 [Abditibacterium sp.]|jgi:hypothetical protein
MQLKPRSTRAIALLTGATIAATTLCNPAPAQADKAKTYKYGAIGLGVLGAYLLSKGKTVPGAAAVAGGVYAYKKGQNEKKNEQYNDYARFPDYYANDDYYANNSEAIYSRNDSKAERKAARKAEKRENKRERRENRRNGADNYDLSPYLR